ncbi:MAG: hypothetical protein ACT4NY_00350 [Pseudonocardiales bacterium]
MISAAPQEVGCGRGATTSGPLVHLVGKGSQLENGRAVAVGGLIVAIIGTIATVIGVWLQFRQTQPPESNTTTATSDTVSNGMIAKENARTLQEVFGSAQNGNCRDADSGHAAHDVEVQHCTFSNSSVYLLLHKYSGVDEADYMVQYTSSQKYRSDLNDSDGRLCAKIYVDTFTGNDGVTYNRKIVHFLSTLFLAEVHAPAELYSKADIEQVNVYFNPDLAC